MIFFPWCKFVCLALDEEGMLTNAVLGSGRGHIWIQIVLVDEKHLGVCNGSYWMRS